jgi:hypothetical protein
MITPNTLPLLLFLLSALPASLALAGLLFDECAPRQRHAAGAFARAVRSAALPTPAPRLSATGASATVPPRRRVSNATGTRSLSHAAQGSLAFAI